MNKAAELPVITEDNVDEKIWIWNEWESCWKASTLGSAFSYHANWPERYTHFRPYSDISAPHADVIHR